MVPFLFWIGFILHQVWRIKPEPGPQARIPVTGQLIANAIALHFYPLTISRSL